MAFDPKREDLLRLGFSQRVKNKNNDDLQEYFSKFSERFVHKPDLLAVSDEDRAFHLVAKAAQLFDYERPYTKAEFNTDEEREKYEFECRNRTLKILNEALALDPMCIDALRMREMLLCKSDEEKYMILDLGLKEIQAYCVAKKKNMSFRWDDINDENIIKVNLCLHPYLRWAAQLSHVALQLGRYRKSLEVAYELLHFDPSDLSDVRYTAFLAAAKLEEEKAIDNITEFTEKFLLVLHEPSVWELLSRACIAYKSFDFYKAKEYILQIMEQYEFSGLALSNQREFSDFLYARLAIAPMSQNEIFIGVSEAQVLFDEGVGFDDKGCFGYWVSSLDEVRTQSEIDMMKNFKLLKERHRGDKS